MTAPLMPKATAVWLIDNTALTFRQIGKFCEIHELEIQAIADGDVSPYMMGYDPIANGQLTKEEIARCEADPTADLVANIMEKNVKEINAKNKKVLTPSQRSDKPAAILWLIHNCPDLTDAQICKLVGTTKPTILSIRNGTREDMSSLRAKDPVSIGLCNELALDQAIKVAKEKLEKAAEKLQKKAVKKKKKAPKAKKTAAKKTTAKASAKKATVKKVPAKKAATKKTVAKKTAAKASAKKATVKKAPAKKAATKKTVAKKTTAKASAKKATVKKAPAKKATTKKTVAKKTTAASAKKATAKKAPAKKVASKKK